MSEQMTDKRYAEFALWFASDRGWSSHEVELFRALRADRQRIAELEAAAKTWENEAERRSRRYEQCVLRAEAAEEVAQLWLNNFKTAEAALERVRVLNVPNLLRSLIHEDLIDGGAAVREAADELAAALGIRADEFTIAIK